MADGFIEVDSSCLVTTSWDHATHPITGRLSRPFQVYRLVRHQEDGYPVITTRNKVRGRGGAFQMRMDTEPGKDCKILGWNLSIASNPIV